MLASLATDIAAACPLVTLGSNGVYQNAATIAPKDCAILPGQTSLAPFMLTGTGVTFSNTGSITSSSWIFDGPTVSGSNYGITTSGVTINNSGTMAISGTSILPVLQFKNATGATVINSGTLLGGTNSGLAAIVFTGMNGATIDNSGSITSLRNATIYAVDSQNLVINNRASGTLSATGAGFVVPVAIASGAASPAVNVSIANAGLITSTAGPGVLLATESAGGAVNRMSNVNITNSGRIVGGSNASGLGAIVISGADTGGTVPVVSGLTNVTGLSITNSGTIDGSASGIAIDNSRNIAASTFANSGTILGNVLLGRGGDTMTFTGGSMTGSIFGQGATGEVVRFNPGAGGSVIFNGDVANVSLIDFTSGTTRIVANSGWSFTAARFGPTAVASFGSGVLPAAAYTTVIAGNGTTSGPGSTSLGRVVATGATGIGSGASVLADLSQFSSISNGARYIFMSGTAPATVGSVTARSTSPVYTFDVLRGDAAGLGQSANDVYLVAHVSGAAQSAVAPQPQMSQAIDNRLRSETFHVMDEVVSRFTTGNGKKGWHDGSVDMSPEFGIWTTGRFGQSEHKGFAVTGTPAGGTPSQGPSAAFKT